MRAIEPFRAGQVVTLRGEVTAAHATGNHQQVGCTVRGTNQLGSLVCLAEAQFEPPPCGGVGRRPYAKRICVD